MKYQQKSFTLPVAQGVSKQDWDNIWKNYTPPVLPITPSCHPALEPLKVELRFSASRNRRKSYRLSDINRAVEKRCAEPSHS